MLYFCILHFNDISNLQRLRFLNLQIIILTFQSWNFTISILKKSMLNLLKFVSLFPNTDCTKHVKWFQIHVIICSKTSILLKMNSLPGSIHPSISASFLQPSVAWPAARPASQPPSPPPRRLAQSPPPIHGPAGLSARKPPTLIPSFSPSRSRGWMMQRPIRGEQIIHMRICATYILLLALQKTIQKWLCITSQIYIAFLVMSMRW